MRLRRIGQLRVRPYRTMKTLAFLLPMFVLLACRTNSDPYSFSGGDGSTRQRAVIVRAPDVGIGVAAEMVWMKERYSGWIETTNRYEHVDGRFYHQVEVTRGGQTNSIYFDYTD